MGRCHLHKLGINIKNHICKTKTLKFSQSKFWFHFLNPLWKITKFGWFGLSTVAFWQGWAKNTITTTCTICLPQTGPPVKLVDNDRFLNQFILLETSLDKNTLFLFSRDLLKRIAFHRLYVHTNAIFCLVFHNTVQDLIAIWLLRSYDSRAEELK